MSADSELAEVVDRHYGALYRFALSLSGSEANACDLVQETFYIWIRKREQLLDAAKVRGWLFTTLYRQFLQQRRRAQRFPEVEVEQAQAELPELPPRITSDLDAARVLELMGQLDETFRGPLALFYSEDCSYEEIAEALRLPIGTVKSRLSRGIAQLRRLLSRDLAMEQEEDDD
jgi:RNA polymerase sigma-70 factor (ECF subfamily)